MTTRSPARFWWDRTRCGLPDLQAVVISLDPAFADPTDEQGLLLGELVWALHCDGVRVAVVTEIAGPAAYRAVREMLGDGAVEVLITGDEADTFPQACERALWELGVADAVTLTIDGAIDQTWSVGRCRDLHRRWAGADRDALSA